MSKNFKDNKFGDMFLSTYSYDISKIQEGISNNYPLVNARYNSLKSSYQEVLNGFNERYGNLGGVELVDYYVSYIFEKFDLWIESSNLHKNRDAEIFLDSLTTQLDQLSEMIEQKNREFS